MIDDDELEIEEYMAKLKLADTANYLANHQLHNDVNVNIMSNMDSNCNLNMTFYSIEDDNDSSGKNEVDDEMEMAKFRNAIASTTIQIPVELKKRFGGGNGNGSTSRRHLLFDGDQDQETEEEIPSLVTNSWLDMTLNSSINSEHGTYTGDNDNEGGDEVDVEVEGISNTTWDKSWNENELEGDKNENDCLTTSKLGEGQFGQFAKDNNDKEEEGVISASDHVKYLLHQMEQEKKLAELIPGAACQALQLENHTSEVTYGYFSHETRKSSCGYSYELYGFIDKFGCMTSFIIDTIFELHKQKITIGRSHLNDLRINDKHISRFVCEIELKIIDSGTYAYLHCLEGNCMVLVDGEMIQSNQTVPIRNYAHIEIGPYKFGYRHLSRDPKEIGPVTRKKKVDEFSTYDGVD